jgi:hypothetical protein
METVVSEKSSGGFWAIFGKISAVLTAIATVIAIYLAKKALFSSQLLLSA